MSDRARTAIFQRLRGAPAAGTVPPRDTAVMRARQWSHEEKIERFTTLLQAVYAEVHRTTSAGWVQTLSQVLARHAVRNVMYAADTDLGEALEAHDGLPERIRYAASIEEFKPALFGDVDAAVTTARAGIAETGTLVLWPTPQEPRLMSLVPPVHVAVLRAEHLYHTFYEVVSEEGWAAGMPTNALLISGPSKTADIEQTLAYGVHGPKALIVLLVESAS